MVLECSNLYEGLNPTETVYDETITCATVMRLSSRLSQNTLDHDSHRDHDDVLPEGSEHVHVMRNSADEFLWHRRETVWHVYSEPITCLTHVYRITQTFHM